MCEALLMVQAFQVRSAVSWCRKYPYLPGGRACVSTAFTAGMRRCWVCRGAWVLSLHCTAVRNQPSSVHDVLLIMQ